MNDPIASPLAPQYQALAPDFTGALRETREEALQDLTDRGFDVNLMVNRGSRYGALFGEKDLTQIVVEFADDI